MSVKKASKINTKTKSVKSVKKAAKKPTVINTVEKPADNPIKKEFIVKSIFMIHTRRIGWIRTIFGGFLQYVSVLEFIFIHLSTIVILYNWILAPFFKIKKFRIKDYTIFDRGKMENMVAFDRLNCEFCAYANGIAKLWNDELDAIAESTLGKGKIFRKLISGMYAFFIIVFLFFSFFFSKVLYLIIALFLGLHWADNKAAFRQIVDSGYAGKHNFIMKWILRFAKLYSFTLGANLEQIESQWCPIKHLEKKGQQIPDHHKNFYDIKQISKIYEALETVGSVSPRKPKY